MQLCQHPVQAFLISVLTQLISNRKGKLRDVSAVHLSNHREGVIIAYKMFLLDKYMQFRVSCSHGQYNKKQTNKKKLLPASHLLNPCQVCTLPNGHHNLLAQPLPPNTKPQTIPPHPYICSTNAISFFFNSPKSPS